MTLTIVVQLLYCMLSMYMYSVHRIIDYGNHLEYVDLFCMLYYNTLYDMNLSEMFCALECFVHN